MTKFEESFHLSNLTNNKSGKRDRHQQVIQFDFNLVQVINRIFSPAIR